MEIDEVIPLSELLASDLPEARGALACLALRAAMTSEPKPVQILNAVIRGKAGLTKVRGIATLAVLPTIDPLR